MVAAQKAGAGRTVPKVEQLVDHLARSGAAIHVITQENQQGRHRVLARLLKDGLQQAGQKIVAAVDVANGVHAPIIQRAGFPFWPAGKESGEEIQVGRPRMPMRFQRWSATTPVTRDAAFSQRAAMVNAMNRLVVQPGARPSRDVCRASVPRTRFPPDKRGTGQQIGSGPTCLARGVRFTSGVAPKRPGRSRGAIMSIWRAGVIAAITVFAATACSKAGEGDAVEKAAPAAVEVPKRKPGLGKQTMLLEGADVLQTVKLCLDETSDPKLAWWGQQGFKQACSKNEINRQPDGSWKFSSACEGAGVKTTNDGAAVGDFSSRYQLRAESTTTGAPIPQMNR